MANLIVNSEDNKIITTIDRQLQTCDSFQIVVAFATFSGINLLVKRLYELEAKGVCGKIIIGTYLNFTEPHALDKLASFSNIELFIFEGNLHSKVYMFRQRESWHVMVGSCNLTAQALTTNEECNIITTDAHIACKMDNTFLKLQQQAKSYEQAIADYRIIYQNNQVQLSKTNIDLNFKPNPMQKMALENLRTLRTKGATRALLVSATGSGKTILAALDVKASNLKTCLFIVHRENIARAALNTFKRVMPNKSVGLLTGNSKQFDCDLTFATIQTLKLHHQSIAPDRYDYIVVDEVHHGGASSYLQVLDYFQAKFNLGMSATPERTDGFNIFKLYDYHIALEFPLIEGLKQGLLAPFHYFGISDATIDGELIDEQSAMSKLTSEQRISHIINESKKYGYELEKVRGLIFVNSVQYANMLSEGLNARGVRCQALSGNDSEEVRVKTIEKLTKGELHYIITVDIFNEGIDIPVVNQVLLLRPTLSPIIYIQQIGRALRTDSSKQFVIIMDFIANYKRNYLIPIAIGANATYDKDVLKQSVMLNGLEYLPGQSTIQFTKIAQEQLINTITKTNYSTIANIRKDYEYLQMKLNRIPKLSDFVQNNLISPATIVAKQNYVQIKKRISKLEQQFSVEQMIFLDYISLILFPAVRIHELAIIEVLITQESVKIEKIMQVIEAQEQMTCTFHDIDNAAKHLARKIFCNLSDEYKYLPFIGYNDKRVTRSQQFSASLINQAFVLEVEDIIEVAKNKLRNEYNISKHYTIGGQYSRKQAYRCGLHDYNNGYQVAGYTVFEKEALIFITLDDSNAFSKYDNQLLDNQTVTWYSKPKRKLHDKDGKLTAEGKLAQNCVKIHIFIKRNSSERFYYCGIGSTIMCQVNMNIAKNYIYHFKLENELKHSLYTYFKYKSN